MNIIKRIISAALAVSIISPIIPCAVSAEETQNTKSIKNDYMEFSVNDDTGFFSINTLEGHPQKQADNNMNLLYDGESIETSFTTVRIDGKDYIFGQDYGLFDIVSQRAESVVDAVENTITTEWTIKDITIKQVAQLSRTENTIHTGNVFLKYYVENKSDSEHDIGIRIMLDNALGEIDAPVTMVQSEPSPLSKESEFISNGRDPGYNIRYLDSYDQPSKEAFISLNDKEASQAPDKIVVGHWYNIASTKWDYVPDKDFSFDTGFNTYGTADTATALYWNEMTYTPGYTSGASITYGVGEFTDNYEDSKFNISMELDGTLEVEDGKYKDDIITGTINVYNNVDGSTDLNNARINIMVDEGMHLIFDSEEGAVSLDEYSGELGFIAAGSIKTVNISMQVDFQTEMKAMEIMASVTGNNSEDVVSVSKYVTTPGLSNDLAAEFSVTDIFANKYHKSGQRVITIKGSFAGGLLEDKTKWKAALVNTDLPDVRYDLDGDKITLTDENEIMAINNCDMIEGTYKLEFAFFEDYKDKIGDKYVSDQMINIVDDPSLVSPDFGIVAVLRSGSGLASKYYMKEFNSEEELNAYSKTMAQDGYSDMPLVFRGSFAPVRDEETQVITGFSMTGAFTINNVLNGYGGSTISYINGSVENGEIKSDGIRIYGVEGAYADHNVIYVCDWKMELFDSTEYTLAKQNITVEPSGVNGYLMNIVGGVINLSVGKIGKSEKYGDIINFSGKFTLAGYKTAEPTTPSMTPDTQMGATKYNTPDSIKLNKQSMYATVEVTNLYVNKEGYVGMDTSFEIGIGVGNSLTGTRNANKFVLHVDYDSINNKYGGSINFAIKQGSFKVVIEFAWVELPSAGVSVLLFDDVGATLVVLPTNPVPIFPPVIGLTQLGATWHDLADSADMIWAETPDDAVKKVSSSMMGVQMQLGALIVQVVNALGTLDLGVSYWSASLVGSIPYIPGVNLTLAGTVKATYPYENAAGMEVPWSINISAMMSFNAFSIFVAKGTLNFSYVGSTDALDDSVYAGLQLYGGLFLPASIPLIGGMELLDATGIVDTNGFSAVATLFGIDVGVQMSWDDSDVVWIYGVDTDNVDQIGFTNMVYVPVSVTMDDSVSLFSGNDGTFISAEAETGADYKSLMSISYSGNQPDLKDLTFKIDNVEHELKLATSEGNYNDGNCFILPDTGSGGKIIIGLADVPAGKHSFRLETDNSGIRFTSMNLVGFTSSAKAQSVTKNDNGTVTVTANQSLKDSQVYLYYTNSNSAYDNITAEKSVDEKGELSVITYKEVNGEKVEIDETLMEDVVEYEICNQVVTEDSNSITLTPQVSEEINSGDYYIMAKVISPNKKISCAYTDNVINYVNDNEPMLITSAALTDAGNNMMTINVENPEGYDYSSYLVSLYNETDGEYEFENTGSTISDSMEVEGESGKTYHAEIKTVKTVGKDSYVTSAQAYKTNSVTVHEPQSVNVSIELASETVEGNYENDVTGQMEKVNYLKNGTAVFKVHTDTAVTGCFVYDGVELPMITEPSQDFEYSAQCHDGTHTIYFKAVNEQGDTSLSEPIKFGVDSSTPSVMLEESFIKAENGKITIKGTASNTETLKFMDKEYTPESDGSFEITESVQTGNTANEYQLTAVGYASQESSVRIFAVNPDFKPIDSIDITAGGETADSITLEPGETIQLAVQGYVDNEKRDFAENTAKLQVVHGNNVATIDNTGLLKAQASGKAYVKAVYDLGSVVKGESSESYKLEDMIEVNVMEKAPDVIPSLPNGSVVTRGTKLELSADGDIYYTTDGSEPTRDSKLYTEPIAINSNMTIKARCVKGGYIDGDVITLEYSVKTSSGGGTSSGSKDPAPTKAPESSSIVITATGAEDNVDYGYMAELNAEGFEDGKIYYTTDGKTPDKTSTEYTEPIKITEDTVIKAVVWTEGDVYSDVYTFNYTLNPYMIKLRDDVDKSQLLTGYPDGTFLPDNGITRAETAALLRRSTEMYGYTINDNLFTDVDMWAKDYINELAAANVITGYPDGTFKPDNMVTRAEFIAMLMRIIDEEGTSSEFADVNGHWAEKYIDKASEYNYISGYPDGTFRPDSYITRAEATVIMTNVLGLGSDGMVSRFNDVTAAHWAFGYIAD